MRRSAILAFCVVTVFAPWAGAATGLLPAPVVYFSDVPNQCVPIDESAMYYYVYVHGPEYPDLTGVSFDLQLSGTWDSDPAIGATGATLTNLDTSSLPYHVEATWPATAPNHKPILIAIFIGAHQLQGSQSPMNVVFTRAGGATIQGEGKDSFAGCCVDCFPCYMGVYADPSAVAAAGQTTSIPFRTRWFCYQYGGATMSVTDTQGWVTSYSPTQAPGIQTCSVCVPDDTYGQVDVAVPEGTPNGASTTVSISAAYGGTATVVVTVDDIVANAQSTWGRIKSLYR